MREITIDGFLEEFKQIVERDKARRFCFILGAGASVTSGIPCASSLAETWLREMHSRTAAAGAPSYREWLENGTHDIKNLSEENIGAMYFQIYKSRFSHDPVSGCRYLEQLMDKIKPSYGYYVLADILARTPHNLVITVNFDNLVADALFFFSRSHPIVCGHNRVAELMPTIPHRPTIIKVHHDIYLDPLNDPISMKKLGTGFKKKLPDFLKSYTPIVIGYGGNDDSLMDGLRDCRNVLGGIYWCMRHDEKPSEKVSNLLNSRPSCIVRIPDFDRFMAQLGQTLSFELNEEELISEYKQDIGVVARELVRVVREAEIARISANGKDPATFQALESAVPRTAVVKPWWHYQILVNSAKTPDEQDEAYRKGIDAFPESAELLSNYATFLKNIRKDFEQAEDLYEKALDIDPEDTVALGNYANFLRNIKKDEGKAADLYRRALALNPDDPHDLGNYAGLLYAKGDPDAETYARRSEESGNNRHRALVPELHFYRYANGPAVQRAEWLGCLRDSLMKGDRSPGWDFTPNIQQAVRNNHPEVDWLPKLASVINDEAPIESLDEWPAWQQTASTRV